MLHTNVVHASCILFLFFFFFNDTATTEIYTLSLHDALPISGRAASASPSRPASSPRRRPDACWRPGRARAPRSEEHTSELQSRLHLVCRLLLAKKKHKQLSVQARVASACAGVSRCLLSHLPLTPSLLPPSPLFFFFFFNDTATTEIYTLSLHDALPISARAPADRARARAAASRRARARRSR